MTHDLFWCVSALAIAYSGSKINDWMYEKVSNWWQKRKHRNEIQWENVDSFMAYIRGEKGKPRRADHRSSTERFMDFLNGRRDEDGK